MARLSMDRRARSNSRGQILPLFALLLTAMLLMSSLLLDGASALLLKREYQSAADAAALAGASASGFQNNGCALSLGSATTAAKASIAANLPTYDLTKVVVTCPTAAPYTNIAVQVSLSGTSPGFFSQVAGISSFAVRTSATAINGSITGGKYSVTLLDPTGCSSASFQGSFSAEFEGSLYVDSSCPTTSSNAALLTGGNSGSITFAAGTGAYVVGGYKDAHTPPMFAVPPVTGVGPIDDPFALILPTPAVPPPPSNPNGVNCTGGSGTIYSPGLYKGGIQVSGTAFLMPGIYYMTDDSTHGGSGGLQVPNNGALYSVRSSFDKTKCFTDPTLWPTPTNCPPTGSDCGVLIVNAATDAGRDTIAVTGSATFKVRPYKPGVKAYENFLLWQLASASPSGTPLLQQPDINLQGGGNVEMTGGVYAPKAKVVMGGGAGGAGGNLTIQFISWDLQLQGTPDFHFYYSSDAFPRPMGYGLVQ
jgi:Flp pilus assembly protein TadG